MPAILSEELMSKKKPKKKLKFKRTLTKQKKKKESSESENLFAQDSDENFYYIAGYTDGGFPYGVVWEEHEKEIKAEIEIKCKI
jgi:hypothetical protein